ncbi:MAG TPA: hypothetical protein VGE47_13765 [Burkholderiaceae bacterium]
MNFHSRWQAIRPRLKAFGLPGFMGLMALLLAAPLALWLAPRWDAQAQALHAEADQTQARWRREKAAGLASSASASARAAPTQAQWRASLPAAGSQQERLADLLDIGLRQGLVAARTEHRLSRDAASGIERLRITMPLNGKYAQLRAYIDAALLHDPGLSLDAIKLRRANAQSAEVEAELQWSLYGQGELK